jgi:hypothetical protein
LKTGLASAMTKMTFQKKSAADFQDAGQEEHQSAT